MDDAFGRRAAVLTRGDDAGAAAALGLLSGHLPNLWEQGKQHLSIEEIRYDLHRFFSLRSSAGQAAAALYHLDRWMSGIDRTGIKDVKAELYADVADPGLAAFVKEQVRRSLARHRRSEDRPACMPARGAATRTPACISARPACPSSRPRPTSPKTS